MPIVERVNEQPDGMPNGGEGVGRSEVGEVVGPLPNDVRVPHRPHRLTDDSEPAVADLVAVPVGAVQDISGLPVARFGHVRQLVA